MRLTQEDFLKGLDLLSAVYGDDYPVFKHPHIAQIWLEFFTSRCTTDRFFKLIKHYVQVCPFFPRVPNDICKIWEESGEQERYNENYLAEQEKQALLALPSQEISEKVQEAEYLKNLSQAQMAENRRRFKMLRVIAQEIKTLNVEDKQSKIDYLSKAPLHELEAIATTCHKANQLSVKGDVYGNLKVSPNALFEDMQKYFHSGSEKYRQVAIDWASDSTNGCELVMQNGKVVDIKQVEF